MGLYPSKPIPDFVTVLANKQVTIGDHVILRCEVNTEYVTTSWEKDGHELRCVEGKHTVKKFGATCVLEIANVQDSDEGRYTINLSNRSGANSCSAIVLVANKEWRTVQWKQDKMLNDLKTLKICNEVQELRFLLYGPVGAGKSSTINTIRTIFEGRQFVNCLAAVGSTTQTICYQRFTFANEEGSFPFSINDVMGVQAAEGLHIDDIISALKGHIKEGYVFNSKTPLVESNHYYNKNTSLSDQMHCLVYVIQADTVSMLDEDFVQKFKHVSKIANEMEIAQVVFMTKVDCLCPMTKENLHSVYKSKKIRDKMCECSHILGIPMNRIFPVRNYHEETHINEDTNCLMLDALIHAAHWANDYVVKRVRNQLLVE